MTDYSRTYTQEQLDIELLKDRTSTLYDITARIDHRLDSVDNKLQALDSTMRSQFSTTMNYIIGVYGLMLTSILAHIGGVF